MIQVYETDNGIRVVEGNWYIQIGPDKLMYMDEKDVLHVSEKPLEGKLVYTYNDPLKVGQIYPDHVIEHGVKDNMIVLGQGNGYCYRYINGHHGLWFSMGAAGGVETLPVDLYKVLYLGE